ncbi:lysozyme inhibitor LprI family protein [Falsiroseomonas oryziterrae]|uniref:lysozyme inhibitor LprI family protein n=1 Tax=Falsiroseomonas oryziterrae TaxID=2911368 RepID=UPI001F2441BC|nr:lysozyme inhibitor LprI family protein [Roseomonas sp. NPKOSM-4]
MRALVLALLLVPGLALAQQQQRPQQAPRQDDLGAQVDRNLRTCVGNSQDMALAARCMDAQRATIAPRLDRAVERLLATQQDPGRRAALSEVQAAWATYRDRRCDFAGTNPDRAAEAAADRAACLLQFDVGRIVEIEATLEPPRPAPQPQQQRR